MTKIAPSFNSAKLMFSVTGRLRSVRPPTSSRGLIRKGSSAPSLVNVIVSHRTDLLSPVRYHEVSEEALEARQTCKHGRVTGEIKHDLE